MHFNAFHVLQTLNLVHADIDAGIPARGLHGEAYDGHVFWDELFVYPFVTLRRPRLTPGLLAYRHRRLDAAKLLTPSVRYSQPGLQAHITYLYGMTNQADQKVGRDAVERYRVLRRELDAIQAEARAALGATAAAADDGGRAAR